jgi:multidrug transporter EmrE-like cation transporter
VWWHAPKVMSVKALGIALKLTFQGQNQLIYPQTSVFAMVVVTCVLTQMNYLNKALDTFNTAVVSPIYYVMFTSLTILASAIMFKDWDQQSASQIITELCGFVTILSGTFLLHATKDMGDSSSTMGSLYFTFRTPSFLLSLSIGLYPMGSNLAITGPGMCLSYLKPLHSCIWLFPIV